MKITDLAKEAGVNRGQVGEYESGKHAASEPWIRKLENTLDRIEHEVGMDQPSPRVVGTEGQSPVIRFIVDGVYGANSITVEAPVDNPDVLAAAVDQIMRSLRGDEPQPPPS